MKDSCTQSCGTCGEECADRTEEQTDFMVRPHAMSSVKKELKNEINKYFCIGGTKLEKKNNLYKYFLNVVVGENGFEKKETTLYDTGWGLYFSI